MESPEKIILVDKEGVEHSVDGSILDLSEYLKSMKENGGIQNNRVVLDMIQGSTLTKIIEFCIEHRMFDSLVMSIKCNYTFYMMI